MSNVVVLPIPSVPKPTLIPFFLNFPTLHIPDDNLQLLIGLCDIPPFIFFSISKSESDMYIPCANTTGTSNTCKSLNILFLFYYIFS